MTLKRGKTWFVIFVLTCAPAASFAASAYYVSPTGNDANAGTSPAAAWQTITKVNGRTYSAGDSILFEGGQTFSGRIYLDTRSTGTAETPIVVSSYGTGRATIDGALANTFYAYNTAGIKIANLKFIGAGPASNTGAGIIFYCDLGNDVKLNHIEIDDVDVSGFRDGIRIAGKNGTSGYSDVRITRSIVHDNQRDGLRTSGYTRYALSNVYIGHCQFFNNKGDPALTTNSGSGVVLGQVDGAIVERCLAHDNGSLCTAIEGGCGIWCHDSRGVVIQLNESWNNRTSGTNDGGGFDLDGGTTESVMQYNYSHDNDGAGFGLYQFRTAGAWGKNIVRYNISQNDGRRNSFAGIQVADNGGGLSDCEVYNNTVFMSPTSSGSPRAVWFLTSSTNFHLRNNIFITTGGLSLLDVVGTQAGWMFQNNVYWSSGDAWNVLWNGMNFTDLPSWQAYTGQETMDAAQLGRVVDPFLMNAGGGAILGDADLLETLTAYSLRDSSPLIDTAMNLSTIFGFDPGPRDFFGSTLPQHGEFDVGACEFVGAAAPIQGNSPPPNGAISPVIVSSLKATGSSAPKSGRLTIRTIVSNLTADFPSSGQAFTLDVAGASGTFTLDKSGRAISPEGRARFKWTRTAKMIKAQAPGVPTLTIDLYKGDWNALWAQNSLISEAEGTRSVDIAVSFWIGNKVSVAVISADCTNRNGKYRVSKK